jgi:hypothetical protein
MKLLLALFIEIFSVSIGVNKNTFYSYSINPFSSRKDVSQSILSQNAHVSSDSYFIALEYFWTKDDFAHV